MTWRGQNVYGAWKDGDATAMEALRSLCDDYEELDQTYKQFEAQREVVRVQISEVLARVEGEQAEIKGFGTLRITAATLGHKWDGMALTTLAAELENVGLDGIAKRIMACRSNTSRSGGLRIEREKR